MDSTESSYHDTALINSFNGNWRGYCSTSRSHNTCSADGALYQTQCPRSQASYSQSFFFHLTRPSEFADGNWPIVVEHGRIEVRHQCLHTHHPHLSDASFVPTTILRPLTKVTRPRANQANNTKATTPQSASISKLVDNLPFFLPPSTR